MRDDWRKRNQLLKLGIGAFCISMGYTLWVPFVITNQMGGAKSPVEIRLAGILLLGIGTVLMLLGLNIKDWKEWAKLFLFFGFLQISFSFLTGQLALFALCLSGDNGRIAKEAADYGSMLLALPLHAWMLCLTGRVCLEGRFSLWFPIGLFLRLLLFCTLAALCQFFMSWIPQSTAGILSQGLAGGCLLFGILYLMLELTEQCLLKKETKEEGGK